MLFLALGMACGGLGGDDDNAEPISLADDAVLVDNCCCAPGDLSVAQAEGREPIPYAMRSRSDCELGPGCQDSNENCTADLTGLSLDATATIASNPDTTSDTCCCAPGDLSVAQAEGREPISYSMRSRNDCELGPGCQASNDQCTAAAGEPSTPVPTDHGAKPAAPMRRPGKGRKVRSR